MRTHRTAAAGVGAFLAEVTLFFVWLAPLQSQEKPGELPKGAVAQLRQPTFWHRAALRCAAFSPDEALVATFGADNNLCLWETATGKLRSRFAWPLPEELPPARVLLAASGKMLYFSGDGKAIAIVDAVGGVCRLWDSSAQKEIAVIGLHSADEDPEPAPGPAAAALLRKTSLARIALAHDARLVATVHSKDNGILLYAPGKKEPVHKLAGQKTKLSALAFAPNAKTLAAAGEDQTIRIWDVAAGKIIKTLIGHRAAANELAYSTDGRRLVSGSSDGSLRVWDVETGKALLQAAWRPASMQDAGPESNISMSRTVSSTINQVWLDPDDRGAGAFYSMALGTGTLHEDGVVRFDLATGKVLSRQILHDQRSTSISISSKTTNRVLAGAGAVAVAPQHNLLARSTPSNHLQLLSLETGAPTASGVYAACADVAMAGPTVAIVQQGDPTIYAWNWQQQEPLRKLVGHTGKPFLIGMDPRGGLLVSASRDAGDRSISVWDTAKGAELRQLTGWAPGALGTASGFIAKAGNTAAVSSPQLSPDGKRLAYRETSGKLRIVECATAADVAHYDFTWTGEGSLAFTPDGRQLVLCNAIDSRKVVFGPANPAKGKKGISKRDTGSFLSLIDVADGKQSRKLNDTSYDFHITRIAVSGRQVLAACSDGAIRVIDLASGKAGRDVWPTSIDAGRAVSSFSTLNRTPLFALSPDCRMLVIRSPDEGSIHVVEVATGKERLRLPEQASVVTCLAFNQDGRYFVTGNQESAVTVWGLDATGGKLSEQDREAAWANLLNDDAGRGLEGIRKLLGDPASLVQLAQAHLKATPAPNEAAVRAQIRDLDHPSFTTRQKTQEELSRRGDTIRDYLEAAANAKETSSEAKQRLGVILKRIDSGAPSGESLRTIRVLELLERIGTPEAQAVLNRLAGGASGASVTAEARAILARLKDR